MLAAVEVGQVSRVAAAKYSRQELNADDHANDETVEVELVVDKEGDNRKRQPNREIATEERTDNAGGGAGKVWVSALGSAAPLKRDAGMTAFILDNVWVKAAAVKRRLRLKPHLSGWMRRSGPGDGRSFPAGSRARQ